MTARRFLVFVRSDGEEWHLHGEAFDDLSVAGSMANALVSSGTVDRASVMEVGSVDAVPQLTYRFGAKRT